MLFPLEQRTWVCLYNSNCCIVTIHDDIIRKFWYSCIYENHGWVCKRTSYALTHTCTHTHAYTHALPTHTSRLTPFSWPHHNLISFPRSFLSFWKQWTPLPHPHLPTFNVPFYLSFIPLSLLVSIIQAFSRYILSRHFTKFVFGIARMCTRTHTRMSISNIYMYIYRYIYIHIYI